MKVEEEMEELRAEDELYARRGLRSVLGGDFAGIRRRTREHRDER